MAFGFYAQTSDGVETVDGVRLCRMLGFVSVTAGVSGSVSNSALGVGTPFYYFLTQGTNLYASAPRITVTSSSLSWTFQPGYTGADGTIIYGVF